MHPGQLTPDEPDVVRLVARQFPALAGRRVTAVDSAGTVNALFRVGDDLVTRLPLHPTVTRDDVAAEVAPARRIAGAGIPVAMPEPVALGAPDDRWPVPWSPAGWSTPPRSPRCGTRCATRRTTRPRTPSPTATSCPATCWGVSRRSRSSRAVAWCGGCKAEEESDAVVASATMTTPQTPCHGAAQQSMDLRETPEAPGRRLAVLDAEIAGVADPAVDLAPAWNLLAPGARAVFRAEVGVDDPTWDRGRAWALVQAVGTLAYYRVTNPRMSTTGARTLAALLAAA